ncbi:MAG: YIP1 family protein [Acetatifactor sp.]|nr:YIP1 family protein [Acetatifactor sp.]
MLTSARIESFRKFWKSFKFAFYCATHPLDGFWDLSHEKRGSYAAANVILILTIMAKLMKLQFTSFVIEPIYWEEVNIFLHIASILFPLVIFVVGNWATTTLFDGKGRLGSVYIATCYSLLPYPLIQFPLIILSNVVTSEEKQFYSVLSVVSLIWVFFWIILAMGQIHEFSVMKNALFTIASLAAMLIIVFLLLLFFSMISQGVAYFISLGREIIFRSL